MTPLASIWLKDLCSMRNLGRLLRQESIFKVCFILLFAAGMMGGFFVLFLQGFQFLASLSGGGFMITRRLFSLFFLGLGAMLIMSNLITSYSTLFRSRETSFLLTSPISERDFVAYKFVESTLLSSWAFFFLMIPFTTAYAWHQQLGLLFGLWTGLFSIPFVLLCGAIGTLVSLAIVRWAPRGRWVWILIGLVVLGLTTRLVLQLRPVMKEEASFVLNRLLPGLQAASHPLMPNFWTAEGIMALAGGQWGRGGMLWLVLATNTAMLTSAVLALGSRVFYPAYQRVAGSADERRRPAELLAGAGRFLAFLPHDIRGMVMKDIRTFLRDPMQWSQALIFFGLLAIYFSSFRSFHYNEMPPVWRNLIVFLNIFSVSSVTCSLASRFVFPQLSLEGHSFWILGLAPTGMRRILLTKFALSASALILVSTGLMGLAAWMLQASGALSAISIGLALAISLSVTALSVGMGALFVDLKQANPVAIISGFGGTMNLALSLGIMLGSIIPFGLVWHWRIAEGMTPSLFLRANLAAATWVATLTVVSVIVPLGLGLRSLRHREY